MLALNVCLPQPYSRVVRRVKIKFTVLPTHRFVFTTVNSMKYVENWIPLRILVDSRNTQPHINSNPKIEGL